MQDQPQPSTYEATPPGPAGAPAPHPGNGSAAAPDPNRRPPAAALTPTPNRYAPPLDGDEESAPSDPAPVVPVADLPQIADTPAPPAAPAQPAPAAPAPLPATSPPAPVPAVTAGASADALSPAPLPAPATPPRVQASPGPSAAPPGLRTASATEGRAIIVCEEVKKSFSGHRVLDGVTCIVPEGEITVIMGPSGTGKSVLLRHFVGLLTPDSGDVLVDGRSVQELDEEDLLELRRNMGMLFQDGALFSSMNLFDNVAFPLRQHTKESESRIRETVMARLREVGLAGAEKRMPNELSGGMRKRAGFARALVLQPKILLFDEPDSGLDPVRTALLCELIKEIQRKYGTTAVVISHDIKAVFEIADHIVLLHAGRVVDQGPKEQIKNSSNQFTQQFIKGAVMGPLGMD